MHWTRQKMRPSNTSGGSNFSGFLCFVIGMTSLTCAKFVRAVKYCIVDDMIVKSYPIESSEREFSSAQKDTPVRPHFVIG